MTIFFLFNPYMAFPLVVLSSCILPMIVGYHGSSCQNPKIHDISGKKKIKQCFFFFCCFILAVYLLCKSPTLLSLLFKNRASSTRSVGESAFSFFYTLAKGLSVI